MSEDMMPERLWVERISYVDEVRYDGWEEQENGMIEYIRANVAQAQLDAANARIAELEAALKECADDLESEVNSRYQTGLGLVDPRQQRRYDRDMEPVSKARALLISQP